MRIYMYFLFKLLSARYVYHVELDAILQSAMKARRSQVVPSFDPAIHKLPTQVAA